MGTGYREGCFSAQDGLRLYFRDYPAPAGHARTPVLCLGGLSRNSKDFEVIAQRLSKHRRVVCPDYRGRGRSAYARDWRTYHPRVYLSDLVHLFSVARLHGFAVVGTSMGGLLAMGLASVVPGLVRGAVLNDIGPAFAEGSLDKIFRYVGQDAPQSDLESAVAFLREAFAGEVAFRDESTWRHFAEGTFRRGDDGLLHVDWDPAIVEPLKRSLGELPDLWKVFAALGRVPVLALRGELSTVLSPATLEEMAVRHPGLRALTVRGVGHTPSLEEPEVVEAIDDFLADLDADAGIRAT